MFENITNVAPFYTGWEAYQNLLIPAIAPLTDEQLDLRPAPHLRSIREALNHIIAVRVRWYQGVMGESGEVSLTLGIHGLTAPDL
jgi:uncharacterized damage-inducible protein DinB